MQEQGNSLSSLASDLQAPASAAPSAALAAQAPTSDGRANVQPEAAGPLSGLTHGTSRTPLLVLAIAGVAYLVAAGVMVYRDQLVDLLRGPR